MKKIQVVILDDQPVRSGLPKLRQLAFATESGLDGENLSPADLELSRSYASAGVWMRSISPQELTSADPSEWEHTIFLVDVNWHEIPPDTPGFEEMSLDHKRSYGVELAEEILAIREDFDPDSMHILFFSNSRADLVDQEVRRWQQEGVANVSALFLGAGQYTTPKLVEDFLEAYRGVISLILREVTVEVAGAILKASKKALEALAGDPDLKLGIDAFLGHAENAVVGGYRLADLAYPFYNAPDGLKKRALKTWHDLFDARYLRIPPIVISQVGDKSGLVKQPSEAALVLQSILRYGLRGNLPSSSKRLAPAGTKGICFADFYLFGAGILQETQLTDPSRAISNWIEKGLGQTTQNPNDWNFFYPLNSCLSNDLGGQLDAANSRNIPAIFKDASIWSVQRAGFNENALLKVQKHDQRPAIFWDLELQPGIFVDCPHVQAQYVVNAHRVIPGHSLQAVYDAWNADQEHYELLEILAEELEQVPSLKISQGDLLELGKRFALAASLLKTAIANIERAGQMLAQAIAPGPEFQDRLLRLSQQLSDYAAPRIKGWRDLQELFQGAAEQCHIPPDTFEDLHKDLLD